MAKGSPVRFRAKQAHPTGSGRLRYQVREHYGNESTRTTGRYESGSVAGGLAMMLQRLGRDTMPRGSTYWTTAHREVSGRAADPIKARVRALVLARIKGRRK